MICLHTFLKNFTTKIYILLSYFIDLFHILSTLFVSIFLSSCVFFLVFEFNFIYFFIQQVLISHQFYTHQCIYVNPNRPPHRSFPPLVSICPFSTCVSQLLPCKLAHLYHFSTFHIHALTYDICFSLSDLLHSV